MGLNDEVFAVTSKIDVTDLILAYERGVFPWPHEDLPEMVPWFHPLERGVLFFDDLHISRSNRRLLKNHPWKVTFCQNFEGVVSSCARVKRKGQPGTWINNEIRVAYTELFKMKKAYSVEVWNEKRELVGGLYGVVSKRYLSAESMFFIETGASKVALFSLIFRLKSMGLSFLDTQMVSPLVESLGGREIPRNEFQKLILNGKILTENFYKELTIK